MTDRNHCPTTSENLCRRCGTCCRKGGPGLHRADLALRGRGLLPLESLAVLRAGEMVRDNVAGRLTILAVEMVKVRDLPDGACPFLRGRDACSIHADRPAECRALFCRDTRAVTALYDRERLSRADFLEPGSALAELVGHHEARCPAGRARELAEAFEAGRDQVFSELLDLVRFDALYRRLLVERAGLVPETLPFFLGRPLAEVLAPSSRRLTRFFCNWSPDGPKPAGS